MTLDTIIAAIVGGLVTLIPVAVAAWLKIKKTTGTTQDKRTAAEKKEGREIAGEYKLLYDEMKREVGVLRESERKCQRRVSRLEIAIAGTGIKLPPLTDDHQAVTDDEIDGDTERRREGGEE
jgi:hypothetical protein